MPDHCSLSPQLQELVEYAEGRLGTEIILSRQADCPPCGILVDRFTYRTTKDVIAYPSNLLGILKECVIAPHVVRLLVRGDAYRSGRYQVLSYETGCGAIGVRQIYLDMLKDDQTRALPLAQKRKLSFYIYRLFHDTLSEIPWWILTHSFVSVRMPALRNGQVYLLIREGLRDMHELVEVKNYIPRRYFIMHNGMFYARDMLLASLLAEYKLNPLVNIPELQKFKNLDLKEMMTHRWSRSHWYMTKIVGDAMTTAIARDLPRSSGDWQLADLISIYDRWRSITDHLLGIMQLPDWYVWEDPEHLASTEERHEKIEREILFRVFGD